LKGTEIKFLLYNVNNPATSSKNSFIITTMTSDINGYAIDIAQGKTLTPTLECFFPCKTCTSTLLKEECTSCYGDVPEKILFQKTCVT
jgi:hypothetical protein